MDASTTTRTEANADPDRLLTPTEARRILGIGRSKLWSLTASGDLPSVRIGKVLRFRRESLLAWIESAERRSMRKGARNAS